LDQRPGEAEPAIGSPTGERVEGPGRLRILERQVAVGARHNALLEGSLRQLTGTASLPAAGAAMPSQLTARARRLLQRGQELLSQLRVLADEPYLLSASGRLPTDAVDPGRESDPLAMRFRETVAMVDVALRMVQAFPDAASAQLRLCEGLEGFLADIAHRVAGITALVGERRREGTLVERLANLLDALSAGQPLDIHPFAALAEEVVVEAQTAALRFVSATPEEPARFIACHSLTVARVAARVVVHDPEFRSHRLELVLAALVHDAGMLRVPPEILTQPGPLDDGQRRLVEGHARAGADMAKRLLPAEAWLAEAVAGHHERPDGTGYPAGLRDVQLSPLTRLLAVCDVYAALASPRPHRPAAETRAALADTLLLAEQGALDRHYAERLLQLGFYPTGSVVELADGTIGLVVAAPHGRRDLNTPARPVIALLADAQGQPLPVIQHIDLARCEGRSIVRSLSPAERRELLGKHHPHVA
jgi:HD-GYP domain-containing protein (c-di-GMP phosphodiesterase class II)